jgi:hypothetical protein
MNKSSFFRGFGMGVLFATFILGITCLIQTSDSAVIRRAKKLGMVTEAQSENSYALAQMSSIPKVTKKTVTATPASSQSKASREPASKSSAIPQSTKITVSTSQQKTKTNQKKKAAKKKLASANKQVEKKSHIEKNYEKKVNSFTVKAGQWSDTVSKNLQNAGIIDSASDFDSYLNKTGYSAKIKAGTFKIPSDATYNEIAQKITGN